MKLILGNPGSGKTRVMLELSAKNNIPVLCESVSRCKRLLVKADCYGVKIPSPITLEELDDTVKSVYVDDCVRLFEVALNLKLEGLSINRDEEYELIDLDKK